MTTRSRLAPSGDRGSGTVLVLSLAAVILLVAALLGLLAGSLLARARAQSAADLGALAGAARLQRQSLFGATAVPAAGADASTVGSDAAPCTVAGAVVGRNRARLGACGSGPGGTVTVEALTDGPVGTVSARARAGPRPASGTP